MSGAEFFARAILDCGVNDLEMLDDVGYDWNQIAKRIYEMPIKDLNFHNLLKIIFQIGIEDLDQALNDRIRELEAIPNERELTQDEKLELRELQDLSPSDDFSAYLNYIDTHISLKNIDVYRQYLWDAISDFEQNTGFDFD